MFRLFPAWVPPDVGVDELFAEALRRAATELGSLPGLVVTHSRPAHSGLFDSVLCSAVVWTVILGHHTPASGWRQRRPS
jgi:hypothetical protein